MHRGMLFDGLATKYYGIGGWTGIIFCHFFHVRRWRSTKREQIHDEQIDESEFNQPFLMEFYQRNPNPHTTLL